LAPECHPEGVNQNKETQVQRANSGIDRSHFHHQNIVILILVTDQLNAQIIILE